MKILLTGGSGLLGAELQKLLKVDAPSHDELDITQPIKSAQYDLIIHAAAYTDVTGAETHKKACFDTNVMGTINLLRAYPTTPFVYISSEYAHKPVNYYSETKRAAEMAVEAYASRYLIIRTLFKASPFPYARAFYNQYTMGDYVDVIAPLIVNSISNWRFKSETIYVGTGRKTMLELAMRTVPLIPATSTLLVEGVKLPTDYL